MLEAQRLLFQTVRSQLIRDGQIFFFLRRHRLQLRSLSSSSSSNHNTRQLQILPHPFSLRVASIQSNPKGLQSIQRRGRTPGGNTIINYFLIKAIGWCIRAGPTPYKNRQKRYSTTRSSATTHHYDAALEGLFTVLHYFTLGPRRAGRAEAPRLLGGRTR